MKRKIITYLSPVILIVIAIFVIFGGHMKTRSDLNRFATMIKNEQFEDMKLTIYYMDIFMSTRIPVSIELMVGGWYQEKIIVVGDDLRVIADILERIDGGILTPRISNSELNTRIYYIFETTDGRKIFDMAMWVHDNGNMMINGHEFVGDDVFIEVILPFLSENSRNRLQGALDGIFPY